MDQREKPFSDPEHQGFFLSQGKDAALLIHGFPGTPAEMRPLSRLLAEEGWTVCGPLLPGFGPQIETLSRKTSFEWMEAARESYRRLEGEHARIIIVGNSMGAALALTAAQQSTPAGLVLLAPFTRFASRWHATLWPVIRRFVREVRPFQKADFTSAEMRRVVQSMFKNADPADARLQETLRGVSLPINALDQLYRVGRAALAAAPRVHAPTLILQGLDDLIVLPATTKKLATRMAGKTAYVELSGSHDLVEPSCSGWPEITRRIREFTRAIKTSRM